MSRYSKKEIGKASVLVVLIFIGVFMIAKSLGDNRVKTFKNKGRETTATITNKNSFKNYRKGATTTEYVLTLSYIANNKLTYSQISVNKDIYDTEIVNNKIKIYYLKDNTQATELKSLIDKKH